MVASRFAMRIQRGVRGVVMVVDNVEAFHGVVWAVSLTGMAAAVPPHAAPRHSRAR